MFKRLASGVWPSEVRRGMEVVIDHLDRGCTAMADDLSELERRLADVEAYLRSPRALWEDGADAVREAIGTIGEMRRELSAARVEVERLTATPYGNLVKTLADRLESRAKMLVEMRQAMEGFLSAWHRDDWQAQLDGVERMEAVLASSLGGEAHETPSSLPPVATASPEATPEQSRIPGQPT